MGTLHALTCSNRDLIDLVITYRAKVKELRDRVKVLEDEAQPYEAQLWARCAAASNYIETESGIACLTSWNDPLAPFAPIHLDVQRIKEAAE